MAQKEAHFSPKWKTTSWFNPLCDEADEPGSKAGQGGGGNTDGLLDLLDSQVNILGDAPGSAGRGAQEEVSISRALETVDALERVIFMAA